METQIDHKPKRHQPHSVKTIHVVLSQSGSGLLRRALKLAHSEDYVVGFPDDLGFGPINPPDPITRVNWLVNELGFARKDWSSLRRNVTTFWEYALTPGYRRIVWTSRRSAREHAAFLAWVSRLGDERYEVIDVAEIDLPWTNKDGTVERGVARTLGMIQPEVILSEALWNRARPLERSEKDGFQVDWSLLQEENAPLRVIGPTGLTSAPICFFDQHLLSHVTNEWQCALWPIAKVLTDDLRFSQVEDIFLEARIFALVRSGQIEHRLLQDRIPKQSGLKFEFSNLLHSTEVRLPKH